MQHFLNFSEIDDMKNGKWQVEEHAACRVSGKTTRTRSQLQTADLNRSFGVSDGFGKKKVVVFWVVLVKIAEVCGVWIW